MMPISSLYRPLRIRTLSPSFSDNTSRLISYLVPASADVESNRDLAQRILIIHQGGTGNAGRLCGISMWLQSNSRESRLRSSPEDLCEDLQAVLKLAPVRRCPNADAHSMGRRAPACHE